LETLAVSVPAKAGDTGRLFGSVTNADLVTAVRKAGGPLLDKRAVDVAPVKSLGSYSAHVRVHPEVSATITFEVVSE
jgi:large subunit ribosomal protein L9